MFVSLSLFIYNTCWLLLSCKWIGEISHCLLPNQPVIIDMASSLVSIWITWYTNLYAELTATDKKWDVVFRQERWKVISRQFICFISHIYLYSMHLLVYAWSVPFVPSLMLLFIFVTFLAWQYLFFSCMYFHIIRPVQIPLWTMRFFFSAPSFSPCITHAKNVICIWLTHISFYT